MFIYSEDIFIYYNLKFKMSIPVLGFKQKTPEMGVQFGGIKLGLALVLLSWVQIEVESEAAGEGRNIRRQR